jgi:putative membrane protein
MTTRTTFALLMAAGLVASPATAQDTGALTGGEAATRSPATSPIDTPPVTNRGVIGNEVPGRRVVPGGISQPGELRAGPGMRAMVAPGRVVFLPPDAGLDQIFAAAAAASNLSEVAMARIAVARGSADEVKLFAQSMIADHSKANNELIALATSKAMGVPMSLEIQDRASEAVLLGKTGDDFDKAYAHQQLAAHMGAVALFEAEAERGRDPQLRAWAAKMLPTLRDHKMRVKRMHDDLEAKSKPTSPR